MHLKELSNVERRKGAYVLAAAAQAAAKLIADARQWPTGASAAVEPSSDAEPKEEKPCRAKAPPKSIRYFRYQTCIVSPDCGTDPLRNVSVLPVTV